MCIERETKLQRGHFPFEAIFVLIRIFCLAVRKMRTMQEQTEVLFRESELLKQTKE